MTEQPAPSEAAVPPPSVDEVRTAMVKALAENACGCVYEPYEPSYHPDGCSCEATADAALAAFEAVVRREEREQAEARVQGLTDHHREYVEGKMAAYGVDMMYEHDCSLGDECPVVAVASEIGRDAREEK